MDVVRISGRNPNGNDKLETMEPSWERQINDGKTSAEVTAERSFVFFLPAHLHNLKNRLQIPPPPRRHTHTHIHEMASRHRNSQQKKHVREREGEMHARSRSRSAPTKTKKKRQRRPNWCDKGMMKFNFFLLPSCVSFRFVRRRFGICAPLMISKASSRDYLSFYLLCRVPTRADSTESSEFSFVSFSYLSTFFSFKYNTHTHTHMYTHTTTTFSWERVRKMEVERKRDPIEWHWCKPWLWITGR